MTAIQVGRRERYRQSTRDEAKRLALRQLAEQGAGAISLNAIAREMGMTGPALYRYFGSRDELLTELVVDAYNDLGDAVWENVTASEGLPPAERLRQQATTYRTWALANPHRYALIFGTPVPGYHAPADRTDPPAQRTTAAALALVAELTPAVWPEPATEIDRQFELWGAESGFPPLPGTLLRQTLAGWTRLHGVISLELDGHFGDKLPSADLIYNAEVEDLVRWLDETIKEFHGDDD